MGGSAAEVPTRPDVPLPSPSPSPRASDAERDAAVGELREHFAAGRISHDTFLHRMSTALGARHQSELPPLLSDLPARERPRGWLRAGWLRAGWRSPGWAGSLVSRVRGGLPGRGRSLVSRVRDGLPGRARAGEPFTARGVPRWLPRASGAPGTRRPRGARDPRAARMLPFPRGGALTFSIGRHPRCDLAIDDLTVSRVHARLERTRDGWVLTDLGSTNGTRVNGWLVRDRVTVRAGDLLRFGDTEYVLAGDTGTAGTAGTVGEAGTAGDSGAGEGDRA